MHDRVRKLGTRTIDQNLHHGVDRSTQEVRYCQEYRRPSLATEQKEEPRGPDRRVEPQGTSDETQHLGGRDQQIRIPHPFVERLGEARINLCQRTLARNLNQQIRERHHYE